MATSIPDREIQMLKFAQNDPEVLFAESSLAVFYILLERPVAQLWEELRGPLIRLFVLTDEITDDRLSFLVAGTGVRAKIATQRESVEYVGGPINRRFESLPDNARFLAPIFFGKTFPEP